MSHALLRPMRARVLERLAEPGSTSSLAREVGVPRQNVNYHHPKGEGRSDRLFVGMHPSVAKEQER